MGYLSNLTLDEHLIIAYNLYPDKRRERLRGNQRCAICKIVCRRLDER